MDDPFKVLASRLTIVNARSEVERAAVWLGNFCAQAALPEDLTARLQVALDEVLSNIVNHALAGTPEGHRKIRLQVRLYTSNLELEVTDDGPFFDPTGQRPVPQATRAAEHREGGVGLLFVRTLVDEIRFVRDGEINRLTLCKRLVGRP
jgi:anti-sigma regulatory factor (Ser/Thr protein kinase)